MADMTKKSYRAVLRVELAEDGKTTNRQVHDRTQWLDGEDVIRSEDVRVEMDADAFKEAIGDLYAAALSQIEELTLASAAAATAAAKSHADVSKEKSTVETQLSDASTENASLSKKVESLSAQLAEANEHLANVRKALD